MGLFSRKSSSKSGKEPQRGFPRRDVFSRYGGKLTKEQLRREMWRVPMRIQDKEYVKRVMERFDIPSYSRWITREEFKKGLEEMAKNPRDPIDRREVEQLKKHFLGGA